MLLELRPEMLDEILNNAGCAIAKRAEGFTEHIPGNRQQQVNISLRAMPFLDASEDRPEPACAFAAGRTLAAGLVLKELECSMAYLNKADRFVHHDDCA